MFDLPSKTLDALQQEHKHKQFMLFSPTLIPLVNNEVPIVHHIKDFSTLLACTLLRVAMMYLEHMRNGGLTYMLLYTYNK